MLDPEKSRALKLFRRRVPMTDDFHGQRFLIRRNGVLLATPLLAVLVLVEVTDIIFAVDSIPAIFAVTDEVFLVFTANAFAILGLRAMYFLLADLIHRFIYLKIGLALVLIWVGIKMLLKIDIYYIPTPLSLAVIATILGVSIGASLWATRGQGRRAPTAPDALPVRNRLTRGNRRPGATVARAPRQASIAVVVETSVRNNHARLPGTGKGSGSRPTTGTPPSRMDLPHEPRARSSFGGRRPSSPHYRHRREGRHHPTLNAPDPQGSGGRRIPSPGPGRTADPLRH